MHPFFDPATMSEDELREKLMVLQQRIWASHVMGMSFDLRDQLEHMVELIEFEIQQRFAVEMQKAWDEQFPDVIETEPDLKPGADAKKNLDSKGKPKKEGAAERPKNAPSFNKVFKKK